MCKLPFLALAVLAAASPGAAEDRALQGTVTGAGEFPISGAVVEVVETKERARTDWFGVYRLERVPAGAFTLRVTAVDFEPAEFRGSAQTVEFPVRLTKLKRHATSIEVVARSEDLRTEIPGSMHLILEDELEISKPLDANEVLRRAPGVTVREDSGPMAMRLNVGIRGLNPDRSRKVLMLEDGIPIALAPYGEPEMYYSPPVERMRRVEILKGSGQIVHGPQTVGGVVNFVTPDPPSKLHGDFDIEGGGRGPVHRQRLARRKQPRSNDRLDRQLLAQARRRLARLFLRHRRPSGEAHSEAQRAPHVRRQRLSLRGNIQFHLCRAHAAHVRCRPESERGSERRARRRAQGGVRLARLCGRPANGVEHDAFRLCDEAFLGASGF